MVFIVDELSGKPDKSNSLFFIARLLRFFNGAILHCSDVELTFFVGVL